MMPLGMAVGFGPGHIVLDGDLASPLPKRNSSPQFSAHVCCGQTAGWIKMPLGREADLGPGHIVLDVDPAPPKGYRPPHRILSPCLLWPNVWMDQGATWLDGDPAPPKKRYSPPLFGPCLLWPNDWMDQDATWYKGKPRPRPHCVRWGSSSPPVKRGTAPKFSAHVLIVAKRPPISATAEHLFCVLIKSYDKVISRIQTPLGFRPSSPCDVM